MMKHVLRDKILEAVDEDYLYELKEHPMGYLGVTARDMLNHFGGLLSCINRRLTQRKEV